MRSTIDSAGRVVIPKPLRDQLELRAGEPLEISTRDGRIEIEPLATTVRLQENAEGRLRAVPDAEMPALTDDDVRDAIERTRR